MTKRKFLKAGLLGHSLLLMATASATNKEQNPVEANQKVLIGVTSLLHQLPRTDSVTLKSLVVDSSLQHLQDLYASEVAAAPKARLNSRAKTYVAQYLDKNSEELEKVKDRSHRYFSIIESIFKKNDLPIELKYLAVIESGLKTTAVSRVGAVGPWQFMAATARAVGLKVTHKYDERKNFYKSTGAAAKYLKDLYKEYEDWLLVIAAYNAGPGYVNAAIKKSGSRNFWHLQRFLPKETQHHVKRFIGAHYFFEGGGSEVTLTKAEAALYRKDLERFQENQRLHWEELIALMAPGKKEERLAPHVALALTEESVTLSTK
jgi:membrane-bound lytic murein transglycosylase D